MKDFQIQAIGLMSGTSLDGLDVCCCTFRQQAGKWSFHIDCAKGYSYPDAMKQILGTGAQTMSALEFITFHSSYGKFLGERVNEFMQEFGVHPDIIASHGHTIFHEPQKRIMYQIGDGAAIAAETRIPTVSDFRRLDIMLGGQGAPLVPIGDRLLFADYDFCLNIGGFSNISFEQDDTKKFLRAAAHDELDDYIDELNPYGYQPFTMEELLDELNGMDFYHQSGPKSLGREWVETLVYPMLERYGLSMENMLRTFYEHAAWQISRIITARPLPDGNGKLLITGGGAFNKFLIERIDALCPCEIVIPSRQIIEYKEALIFAFLAALYMADTPGCLASVTGATTDNIGGMLFKI